MVKGIDIDIDIDKTSLVVTKYSTPRVRTNTPKTKHAAEVFGLCLIRRTNVITPPLPCKSLFKRTNSIILILTILFVN
jgi:hypothetical protein